MLSIRLTFTAGRFHATPWGRHVNEGATEWPPSPWRLLRALVAVWHAQGREALAPRADLEALLGALSSEAAHFVLPAATETHSRHYMPQEKAGDTAKVLDAFVLVAKDRPLTVTWPNLNLLPTSRKLLSDLLLALPYLGRAESWVEAELLPEAKSIDPAQAAELDQLVALPQGGGHQVAEATEVVQVLSPLPPEAFEAWRQGAEEAALMMRLAEKQQQGAAKGKSIEVLSAKDAKEAKAKVPASLLDALELDTSTIREQGWSGPPGAKWVAYLRPQRALQAQRGGRPTLLLKRPSLARFVLHASVPPSITDAIAVGETARQAALKALDRISPDDEAYLELVGRSAEGQAAQKGHVHAHFLPEALGRDAKLTHLTVWAPGGFGPKAQAALGSIRKLWGHALDGREVELRLEGFWAAPEGATEEALHQRPWDKALASQGSLLGQSTCWVSRTPMVLNRHPKRKADGSERDAPEDQVRRELLLRGFPEPVLVERCTQAELGGQSLRWTRFRRWREKGGGSQGPNSQGYGFRIVFPEAVSGPIALGYASHFGLGLFVPCPAP